MVGMSQLVKKLKELKKLLLYKRDLTSSKPMVVGNGIESDILRYIGSNRIPKTQRDVINKFNSVHERTIRRYINRLIKNNLVKRSKQGREVVYSARLSLD